MGVNGGTTTRIATTKKAEKYVKKKKNFLYKNDEMSKNEATERKKRRS